MAASTLGYTITGLTDCGISMRSGHGCVEGKGITTVIQKVMIMKIDRRIQILNRNINLLYRGLQVVLLGMSLVGLYFMLFMHVPIAVAMILVLFGSIGSYLIECDRRREINYNDKNKGNDHEN